MGKLKKILCVENDISKSLYIVVHNLFHVTSVQNV